MRMCDCVSVCIVWVSVISVCMGVCVSLHVFLVRCIIVLIQNIIYEHNLLKGQSAKFLSFNMLIGALDGAHVQNLCSVPHFNPKL